MFNLRLGPGRHIEASLIQINLFRVYIQFSFTGFSQSLLAMSFKSSDYVDALLIHSVHKPPPLRLYYSLYPEKHYIDASGQPPFALNYIP